MRGDVDYIISLMKEFTFNENESELGEQDDAGGGSTGGSTGGGGSYPTVTKWSSGRTPNKVRGMVMVFYEVREILYYNTRYLLRN
jgi:hypothetical protein